MNKTSAATLFGATFVALLAASSTFAQVPDDLSVVGAPRVASPAKLGSLLIWPAITINPVDRNDTVVEVSNNNPTRSVEVECEYVNELKGRVDFSFQLTPNQTVSWDVYTHTGDQMTPPPFPEYVGSSGLPPGGLASRGELVCFAVNTQARNQISFNFLSGTATPVKIDATAAAQPKMAYRYNAWAFADAPYSEYSDGSTPGVIILDGINHYDACPALNQANFQANGSTLPNNNSGYGLNTIENDLRGVGCYQDLRQDYQVHLTKLLFTVWNSLEQDLTGTYECVDSVFTVPLISTNTNLTNNTAFDYTTLQTINAHFQVSGVASDQCSPYGTTENVGLLGVLTTQLTPGDGALGANQVGNLIYGEGIFGFMEGDFPSLPIGDTGVPGVVPAGLPGYVLWDPVQ
jgi:hypothetical protein